MKTPLDRTRIKLALRGLVGPVSNQEAVDRERELRVLD